MAISAPVAVPVPVPVPVPAVDPAAALSPPSSPEPKEKQKEESYHKQQQRRREGLSNAEALAAVAQTEEQQRLLFSGMLAEEFYAEQRVRHEATFVTNSRGMRLFSQVWMPEASKPKALICCCHGYSNDTSWTFQLTCVKFASEGYAVCALDYEGHGRSDGLHASFRSADAIAQDCLAYFTEVHLRTDMQGLPCFLLGESFGGAIAILIASMGKPGSKQSEYRPSPPRSEQELPPRVEESGPPPPRWAGFLLMSPMLRIKDEMQPHWFLIMTLKHLAYVFPDAPIIPTPETIMMSCKDPVRLKLFLSNPFRYAGKPRLGVGLELLRVTQMMEALMPRITLPFFVAHGEGDVVTDCFSSKELYKQAASQDKSLYLYLGGGHQLLQGDLPELRDRVWGDMLRWLHNRVPAAGPALE